MSPWLLVLGFSGLCRSQGSCQAWEEVWPVFMQLCVWLPESEPLCGKLPLLCLTVVGHRESLSYKNNPEPP